MTVDGLPGVSACTTALKGGEVVHRERGWPKTVKILTLLVGAGIGFVVGSKLGHGPYEQLEFKVRKVAKRPKTEGQETVSPEELEVELSAPG